MGTSFSVQRRAASWSSSTERGWTYQRAGPPMRYQVWGARGTFSETQSSRPAKGFSVWINMGGAGPPAHAARRPAAAAKLSCAGDLLTAQVSANFPYVASAHRHNQVSRG